MENFEKDIVKVSYGKYSKISNTLLFLFSNKMMFRIAKSEDPDLKKQSDLSLHCLSRPLWQATSVQNFRTSTICKTLVNTLIHVYISECLAVYW